MSNQDSQPLELKDVQTRSKSFEKLSQEVMDGLKRDMDALGLEPWTLLRQLIIVENLHQFDNIPDEQLQEKYREFLATAAISDLYRELTDIGEYQSEALGGS